MVRLAAIDAPRKRQSFGGESRQSLADLLFRLQVLVLEHGKDRCLYALQKDAKEAKRSLWDDQAPVTPWE